MVEAFQRSVNLQPQETWPATEELDKVRLGNIMARVRMIVLFDQAKQLNALVLGTENKSEHYLGYYTRFGDEASDIEPLRNLYKTEVYRLAEYLGVLPEIRDAVPSAGLWPGQSDEGQFGFTYEAADEILYGLYDARLFPQELVERGMDKKAIDQVQAWVTQMAFKHDLPRIAPEPVCLPK
jgi:NAD+ synthase